MTKEEIGSILKKLRISSGKTQKEIAELLGRKQQIIGHWETGYSQPDANTLFLLCDLYGTTVDHAFGFNKNNRLIDNNLTASKLETIKRIEKMSDNEVNAILAFINSLDNVTAIMSGQSKESE